MSEIYTLQSLDMNIICCALDQARGLAVPQMSERDQARYLDLKIPDKKRRFVESRILIDRFLESAPLAPNPATLHVTDAGQPILSGHGQPAISWSRSDDHLAIGLSTNGSIGLDIETWQDRPFGPMLKMICSDEELQRYQASNVTQNPAYFFRVWTMKEAILKSVGTGFQTDVKRVVLPQSLLTFPTGETLDVMCLGTTFETTIIERDGLTLSIARDTTGLAQV